LSFIWGATTVEKEKDILLLIKGFHILPFDRKAGIKAAEIYKLLKQQNKIIEFRDIFIAATCIVNNQSLITLNNKHFERIQELKLYASE
jgi:tRNA(fMet)-specific endonuclease VapC